MIKREQLVPGARVTVVNKCPFTATAFETGGVYTVEKIRGIRGCSSCILVADYKQSESRIYFQIEEMPQLDIPMCQAEVELANGRKHYHLKQPSLRPSSKEFRRVIQR